VGKGEEAGARLKMTTRQPKPTTRPASSPAKLSEEAERTVEKAVERYRALLAADMEAGGCIHYDGEGGYLCWRCEDRINANVMRSLALTVEQAALRRAVKAAKSARCTLKPCTERHPYFNDGVRAAARAVIESSDPSSMREEGEEARHDEARRKAKRERDEDSTWEGE
jgi:hypothetical protein